MRVTTDLTPELHLVFTLVRENVQMNSALPRTANKGTEPLKAKNRRAAIRYAVKNQLQYRTADATAHSAWKRGRAIDMSAKGILVDIPEAIPVGSILELEMDWLGIYHGSSGIRLFLTASVTRIDQRGTALRILSHQFRDVRPAAVAPRRQERKIAVA